ncbi:hypothetical protein GW17_00009222 [Ensete ventricosum]|nr:hypothetical protein GW17_00009222 [Ensete ventricosum]
MGRGEEYQPTSLRASIGSSAFTWGLQLSRGQMGDWLLEDWGTFIKELNSSGFEVIMVTSGAVGVGRQRLRYRKLVNSSFADLQKPQVELDGKACASVGQITSWIGSSTYWCVDMQYVICCHGNDEDMGDREEEEKKKRRGGEEKDKKDKTKEEEHLG